jgi:uncharacterized protein (TIGR02466 family)
MNKNQIYPLWPILVGEFHNPNHQEIKKELIDYFKNYESEHNTSRAGVENYNLFESKYNLHQEKNDALLKIFNFIADGFLTMTKNINKTELEKMENKDPKFNVKFKDSWFIRYNKGGAALPHDHGKCSMSCVYYVQVDDNADLDNGSTYFIRPYNRGSTHDDFGGLRYVKGGISLFKAEEGKLLIWPSFLIHGSKPYLGEKNRIIISVNADVNIAS